MRLRTTAAAVFVGAAALVLPTAAPSLADGPGGRGLGTLHYRFVEDDGDARRAQIRPADNDTCYLLTHTSRREPAVEVINETRSQAVLFDNPGCSGRAERVLQPGQRARNLEVVAVFFKPAAGNGRGDQGNGGWNGREDGGRGEQGDGEQGNGGWNGREDGGRGEQGDGEQGNGGWNGREDEGRGEQGRGDEAVEEGGSEDATEEEEAAGEEEAEEEEGLDEEMTEEAEEFVNRIVRSIG
ncbi:hypothetical protein OG264_26575 [Streptomyces xanthophaeus]|uniref:hypothetical protein n=1 Tax=Streptomyces xanthophaeus TaxID=67385 RepID=UPI003867A0F2|nr:hypothetical protein OG264_26575 [Streptomyces xanthophaeus]WST60273.1 hypothetical protein OG605_11870 [Streptomyces xanthophaeus]